MKESYKTLWEIFNNHQYDQLKNILGMSFFEVGMGKMMSNPDRFPKKFMDMNMVAYGYHFEEIDGKEY